MPHYALDTESLHHALLTILLTKASSFSKMLFSAQGVLDRHSPEFDIWIKLDNGRTACIEVKVWHHWSVNQRERQFALIQSMHNADGYIILLGKSAELTGQAVKEMSSGTFRKICYSNLADALDTVVGEGSLSEIAAAYRKGLQQEQRIRTQYKNWDPNA